MPRMLFHRDFAGYTGGHGKVWDYFRHALALGWDARVYLTPASLRDASNPWLAMPERIEADWQPAECDVLFLAGMDWHALSDPERPPCPVVNLLQHVRHAWPELPLRGFLRAPAQRICVSHAVAAAVQATGEVNGAVTVIPAALDLPGRQPPGPHVAQGPVAIAGLKAPELARALAGILRGRGMEVDLLDGWLPRMAYLDRVAGAAVLVALPHPAEGFYLPALEAMAMGVPVVLADCIGSREYTRDGENCVLAALAPEALADAVQQAMLPAHAERLRQGGLATALRFDQESEREAFSQVLARCREASSWRETFC